MKATLPQIFVRLKQKGILNMNAYKSSALGLPALVLLTALAPVSWAGPFVNGSFESPQIPANTWTVLSGLPGWTIGAAATLGLENGFPPGTTGNGPVHGAQWLIFNGGMNPTGNSISQTFDTEVGQTYVVSFKVGKEGGAPGNMQITATVTGSAGGVLGSLAGSQSTAGWGPTKAFFFTATTAASTLTLVDTSSTTIDTDVALDNVSVMPIGPITNGLVAYYPFDGDVNDESGFGNDATLEGGQFFPDRFGNHNMCLSNATALPAALVPNFQNPAPNMTVCVWYFVRSAADIPELGNRILDHSWGVGTFSLTLFQDGFLDCYFSDTRVHTSDGVRFGAWQHLVCVVNGTQIRVFLDGSLVGTALASTNIISKTFPLGIGSTDTRIQFKGLLDDVRIYNRALSDSEVQQLYAFEAAPQITGQPSGQVGYWGGPVSLGVWAGSPIPLSYQWFKDGFAISWGTNSTLTLTNLDLTDGGYYSVVVSNSVDSVASAPALVVVNPAGVSLGLYAGLTINGTVGKNFGIQYTTDLAATDSWTTITNIILTQPTQLWMDTAVTSTSQPRRFYRVIPIP